MPPAPTTCRACCMVASGRDGSGHAHERVDGALEIDDERVATAEHARDQEDVGGHDQEAGGEHDAPPHGAEPLRPPCDGGDGGDGRRHAEAPHRHDHRETGQYTGDDRHEQLGPEPAANPTGAANSTGSSGSCGSIWLPSGWISAWTGSVAAWKAR